MNILLPIVIAIGILVLTGCFLFRKQIKEWFKKHWKKVGTAVVVTTVTAIAYVLMPLGDYPESTYYFDSWDEGREEWTSNPEYMVDGSIETPANTASDEDVELLTTSSYVSGGSGNIVGVEIRAHGSWEGSLSTYEILLRPVFTGGDGDNHIFTPSEGEPDWSSWYNITTDTNAPSPWTWTDVANLDCDVEANLAGDGNIFCSKVELKVTNTSDADPPVVTIKFAGNYSDSGGPYWEPPDETTQLTGSYSDGYYVNDSRQQEGWINVTINATDATSVGDVWLNWLNETTWTNWTYRFTYAGGDIYYINTSQNFSTAEGYNYSFNVVVNDTASPVNSQTVAWNKTGSDGSTYIRRHIQMNCSDTDSLDYRIMYLWNATYSTGGHEYDVLHHDGGLDTAIDTGYMLNSIPDDTYNYRSCLAFVWFWFDDSVCIPSSSVKDLYYHIWWDSTASHSGDVNMTWDTSRAILLGQSKEYKVSLREDNKSGELALMPGYKYVLSTEYIDITDELYTDNSIYEFGVVFHGVGPTAGMWIYSNRSALSYIIINIPENILDGTDNSTDTDNDGLSDHMELNTTYGTHTNPFLADTDNDGVSDYHEVLTGSDPNDFTDTIEIYNTAIRTNDIDYFVWLGKNLSAYSIGANITAFDESAEYIERLANNGSWVRYWQSGDGTNFSVYTFDVIRINLSDAVDNETFDMIPNPDMNYTNARTVNLTKVGNGYNYTGRVNQTTSTLSAENSSLFNSPLDDYYWLSLWNETTFTWDPWFCGFSDALDEKYIHQYDVIQTKIRSSRDWVI